MTTTSLDPAVFPQTTAFLAWLDVERSKGLVDVKFFKRDTTRSTVESFAAEINQMIQAPEVPDTELS